jgi:hypothetical protein
MYGLMRGAGLVGGSWEAFQACASDHFTSVFDIAKLVRSERYQFANHVATDGVSLSVHFRVSGETADVKRKALKRAQAASERGPFDGVDKLTDDKGVPYRVLGNDPGRTYMAEVLPDGSTRSFRLTRTGYYEMSGTNAHIRLRQKNQRRFQDAWSDRTSAKTTSLTDLLENAKLKGRTLDEEWSVLSRRCLRRARGAVAVAC